MIGLRASGCAGVLTAATIAIIIAGCDTVDSPSGSEPRPSYEQIPRNLCEEVDFEAVTETFDLTMAPSYEPDSRYATERDFWYERCRFDAENEARRFGLDPEEFYPNGPVQVWVYREVADAREGYESYLRGHFQHRENEDPGAATEEIAGWWHTGVSLELIQRADTQGDAGRHPELSRVVVEHIVRHENLVLWAGLDTPAPGEESEAAMALLHDLAAALIDETVAHLTLAE